LTVRKRKIFSFRDTVNFLGGTQFENHCVTLWRAMVIFFGTVLIMGERRAINLDHGLMLIGVIDGEHLNFKFFEKIELRIGNFLTFLS
jgi:hypothetical protein